MKYTEENENGNRTRSFECGCVATSGAAAYGNTGSAWAYEYCNVHAYLEEGVPRRRRP